MFPAVDVRQVSASLSHVTSSHLLPWSSEAADRGVSGRSAADRGVQIGMFCVFVNEQMRRRSRFVNRVQISTEMNGRTERT